MEHLLRGVCLVTNFCVSGYIVLLLSELWTTHKKPSTTYTILHPSAVFSAKFNHIQEQLEAISGMDELLSG